MSTWFADHSCMFLQNTDNIPRRNAGKKVLLSEPLYPDMDTRVNQPTLNTQAQQSTLNTRVQQSNLNTRDYKSNPINSDLVAREFFVEGESTKRITELDLMKFSITDNITGF